MTFAFTGLNAAGRMGLLVLITLVLLVVPIALARRGLIATAETLAAVALLMVLVDGYVAYSEGLFGGGGAVPTQVYFAIVCLATAAVAVAYEVATHLLAPRYATLLVLQPVIPLFAYPLIREPAGWALALALVAMMNLGFAIGLMRGRTLFGAVVLPGEGRAASVLRDAAWLLFAVAYGFSAAYAATALIAAETVSQAVRAALVLVLAAAVGVAGAIQQQRSPLADLTGGLAVLAVIFAAARVSWVATPDYALAITAAAVAATAGSVALLPPAPGAGRHWPAACPVRSPPLSSSGWPCPRSARRSAPHGRTGTPPSRRTPTRSPRTPRARPGSSRSRRCCSPSPPRCCCPGSTRSTLSWSAARWRC
jgi:hypothetical protein